MLDREDTIRMATLKAAAIALQGEFDRYSTMDRGGDEMIRLAKRLETYFSNDRLEKAEGE